MRTELESVLVEQALLMARELEAVTDAAVLAVGEPAAGRLGRELTRVALEAALQRPPRDQGRGGPDDREGRRPGGVETLRGAA